MKDPQVILMPSGRRGQVSKGANLLKAAQDLGVEIESICGGRQTCGKCQVIVEEGRFQKHGIISTADHLSAHTEKELEYARQNQMTGRRLACAAEVRGDVLITVPEESQARKQIIAKAASERSIEIQPAVRQVYIEVEPPDMDQSHGDWERVQAALSEQWGLQGISIDSSVLPGIQQALRDGNFSVTVSLWQDREVLRVEAGYSEGVYGLAVDIGSTTVVAHLCDLRTGQVLTTQAAMNPQVRYGEDLMSRVSYATGEPQGLSRLNRAIIRTLNDLAQACVEAAGLILEDILDVVVVGNPVMQHLFLGINPKELGTAPFSPAIGSALDLKARDIGLHLNPATQVHVLPLIAGHVGADNLAVQLAESPHEQDEIMLVVDVGTNAEIVLGNRERLLAASSPTGPAFEGAQITHGQRAAPGAIERVRIDPNTLEPRYKVIGYPEWIDATKPESIPKEAHTTGICGSGIIEAIAEMYLAGIINSRGLFEASVSQRSDRLQYAGRVGAYRLVDANLSATGSSIIITQNDVRQIQLAKAALYAGTKLLMAHLEVEHVDRVILAGAFGSFISPFHAMVLGLIPDCALECVTAVGNAAGDGARFALLNLSLRQKATWLSHWVQHISTPLEASFQDEFVAALDIPHARDAFPTLSHQLPKPSGKVQRLRRNKRREIMQV